jgi:D-cysteine desulfhydrase
LFDRWPVLEATVPWMPLARVPTAVEPCDALDAYLGHKTLGVSVWMKRDDLVSPVYGGNKVRRYEFLLADARARGARALYTLGGLASTQATATAVLGREAGFSVRMVLYDQPFTRFAREALMTNALHGASMTRAGNFVTGAARLAWEMSRAPKGSAYLVPPGASTPLPNLGYLDAFIELEAQVRAGECPRPDAIVLPTGSSGTLAALALGARYAGWDTVVIGARIAPWVATNAVTVGLTVRSTARFVVKKTGEARRRFEGARYRIEHGFIGPGYGHPSPEAIEGARAWEQLTGATGEVTYSGKALWALRSLVQRPEWQGKTLLLWNTLSTPRPALTKDNRGEARALVPRAFDDVFEGEVPC